MEILHLVSFGILAGILTIVIRQQSDSIAFFIVLFSGIIIFLFVIPYIGEIFRLLTDLTTKANINFMYVGTILKIIGIAYIAEFGAQITRDAGLGSIASKIELAGKIFILVLAVPILTAVVETILNFIPL
ncbi:stage III sporulation protein AD [Salirhabdus sp. Marseille-P4669]|uniref:stage III sporulation protein AD n=1 Tax=Salirhabdus sp. Marseille-P4669 TaxID=2042310 RepID=UPI000C7C6120|nr:stage III sporulation protein AD [Salirhabdus sp. Marseille-P4669]